MSKAASSPTCPGCDYAMSTDDMCDLLGGSQDDLFALAPNEGRTVVDCPRCDLAYWVQGSYRPQYTSAFAEEELD